MPSNPFSQHSTHPHVPTTAAASLVLKDSHGREVVMRNLQEPFSMFLYESGSSSGLLKRNATLEEYSKPHFYEINITGTNSSLMVALSAVTSSTKGRLRLRIINNQSAVLGNDVIVSTESSLPISWTWRNLNGNGKYYVSVAYESVSRFLRIPDRVQYTISFRDIGCLYWNDTKDRWESNGCQVTTYKEVWVHIRIVL